ncbi:MAG: CARDB domain-containing protein, partial [bacterium]
SDTNWPSGSQGAAGQDSTKRYNDSTGVTNQEGRILAMGMRNPLEPGLYYVGVLNGSCSGIGADPMSYTLLSQGIGDGLAIPVVDVAFSGGDATANNMASREAAYYRVVVPADAPTWQARLSPTLGEAMLKVQWQSLPCSQYFPWTHPPYSGGGVEIQKAGKEQWVLLPENGTNVIRAGTYYIAAVSEGQNPASSDRIGTGPCSWTFESLGVMGVTNLGMVGVTDLVQADTLEGGAAKAYQFTVPPGTVSFEVRLENRVGNPFMRVVNGAYLPSISYSLAGWYNHDNYGNYGGVPFLARGFNVITTPNPASGLYSLIVNASDTDENDGYSDSGVYMDASYTLRVRYPIPTSLNFSANLNTNGQTNVVSGTLADNQREFFKVIIPATNNGQVVVGWRLDLAQSQGAATVRVRKELLPADSASGTTPFMALSALIVPPFLTPGTWYVEVRGTGATTYTLTSRMYEPERPVWEMPLRGDPVTTPGLTAPEFGDTGTDTNGLPLPGDHGIDLENGRFHYYAVNVPTNNAILIRTMLEAISGNPDLYIRAGFPPTLSHDANGDSGSIYERANTGTATEYRNWVPHDGRYESWLTNGVWHFAVRAAGGANCRYRLHISSGSVTDLALDGGSLSGQAVAGGDWRYYRLEVPTNAPAHWNVTFSQQQGDVVMYVRDTSPPGNHGNVYADGNPYADWAHDSKNNGTYLNYDAPGTYDLPTPPLRPGQTYYLGFRAVSDSMFSVSSAVSGVIGSPVLVPFLNGFNSMSIPAYGSRLYAFQVPLDATSWIHSSVHAASVQIYLEQGTLPGMDTTADWRSAGAANSRFNQTLGSPSVWPWMPNQTYYLLATNTSPTEQSYSITMSGPDLMPVTLAWTNESVAGKPLTMVGTVTNRGNDTALASWSDLVYLSSNAVWDAQDVSLGSVYRNQSVAAGGSYTWTNAMTLSQWQPGTYYLIMKVDDWYGSAVFESNEGNDTMAFPVTLTAPDLLPLSLTWTGEAVAGRPLTLVGGVTNQGSGTAEPSWPDFVYLSSNAVWDAQDVYQGYVWRYQSVAAGGSYTWTNTVTLSQWQPGNYYLIVKAD